MKGTAIANELNTDAYNLYDETGKLVSIGYCYECYGIIVNPDLIEKAGHTMDEIKNFDGLKAVAEDIHSRAGELGFDAFSSSDMDGSLPGVSRDIWQTSSITTSRKGIPGRSALRPSPASTWITSRICMTFASTTA